MEEGQTTDRVIDALQDWQKKEKNLISVFGERVLQQREFMKEKLRLYKEAYYGHRPSSSKDEKLTLAILSGEINKLEKKVYPNVIQRLFVQLSDFVFKVFRSPEIPELTMHTFNPQKKESTGSKLRTETGNKQTQNNKQESYEQKNRAAEPEEIYHQKTKTSNAHELSAEAANAVRSALSKNENWLAYSDDRYFLGQGDLYFFKSKDEANEFAVNNISDRESFHVLHFESLEDVYQKILSAEKLRIDPDANPLYNKDGNVFTDALIEHIDGKQFSNNLKYTVMNDKNLEFLKEQMKNMGFGDKLNKELENLIRASSPDFKLKTEASFNNQKIEATLHFRRGEQNEMYFFNKYDVTLKNEKEKKEVAQTFYINHGRGMTYKEAYNLLEGRAVNKDLSNKLGQKYNAWIQIDFNAKDKHGNHEMTQYYEKHGFDMDKELAKHPIKELENSDDRKMLISSLNRGNLQPVEYEKDGQRERMFVEANPKEKSINVYDKDKNLVMAESLTHDQKKGMGNEKEASNDLKQENKKEAINEKDESKDLKQENKMELTNEHDEKKDVKLENKKEMANEKDETKNLNQDKKTEKNNSKENKNEENLGNKKGKNNRRTDELVPEGGERKVGRGR